MRFQYPVSRLMTKAVLWVDVSSPVSEVMRLFRGYPVHHLPVVRESTLVGVLSSADIMKLDGFLPSSVASAGDYLDQKFTIEELMSRPAISIRSDRPVEDAARLMVVHAIHSLPVVDAQDHLLGIITTTDMMQALLFGPSRGEESADTMSTTTSTGSNPGAEAIALSLEAARDAVFTECDPDGIALTLLYYYQRAQTLEEIREAAHRYAIERKGDIETLLETLDREEDFGEQEPLTLADAGTDARSKGAVG